MAFSADLRRKIYAILQAEYYTDKDQLLEDLFQELDKANVFGHISHRASYEEALNKLIKQADASKDKYQVATLLDELSPIFNEDNFNKEDNEASQNLMLKLMDTWQDIPEEIKYLKSQQDIQDFINTSLAYEKEIQSTYSKTQKVEEIFSQFGQGFIKQGQPRDINQESVEKYYTFFLMNNAGTQIQDIITIANEHFESLLSETTTFRLNLALIKASERQDALDAGSDIKLFQNLGYTARNSENFAKTLLYYGGLKGAYNGKDSFLKEDVIKSRYAQLQLANERGIIRDLNNQKIGEKRLAEMLLDDTIFDSLSKGYGYKFNTAENIGALFEGDYEKNGITVSIKTATGSSSPMQLMESASNDSFAKIFKDRASFMQYAKAKLEPNDINAQKQLSGEITDHVTQQLSMVGKGQDFLVQDFQKVIQNNPVLQSLGISSDFILSLPQFQSIYNTARQNQFTQELSLTDKEFLNQINSDKHGFYRQVVDSYIHSKYNPKTGKLTQKMQKWIKDNNYTSVQELSLNFDTQSTEEIHDQVVGELQQTVDSEPEIIFNLSL